MPNGPRRRDLIACLHQCFREFLLIVGNLEVPIAVRLAAWRMANAVQTVLRAAS